VGITLVKKPGLGGFRQKKLQKADPMQLEGGFGGIYSGHVKGFNCWRFKGYLWSLDASRIISKPSSHKKEGR
jgi:hypothetical protein